MAGSPACANPLMCSTSPAATANRRSGRIIVPALAAKTGWRATRSRTSGDAVTPIRQRRPPAEVRSSSILCTVPIDQFCSPPPTAAAPHLAGVAAIEIIKGRDDAAAIPVACNERDPLASRPPKTGRCPCRKPRPVDDEVSAIRGLHDLDHVLLGREIKPLRIVPAGGVFLLLLTGGGADQHMQRE